jgi:hypothetical protein
MAMLLESLGFQTVREPQSRVRVAPAAVDSARTFRRALDAERFFWRWAHTNGWSRSLAMHAATLAAEGGRRLLRPSILPWMAGRLVGSFSMGSHRHCRRRLAQAARAAASPVGAPHFPAGSAKSAHDVHPTAARG